MTPGAGQLPPGAAESAGAAALPASADATLGAGLGAVLQEELGPVARILNEYANLPVGTAETIAGLATFTVVFVGVFAAGKVFALPLLRRVMERRGIDAHARKPIMKVAWFLVVFLAVGVAFGAGGFRSFLNSLAVIAAAGTLAIGFAMQDVLKNFVSGVFIFTEQPFRIGDWIEWDDQSGIVEDVSLRVTRVRTFDNELLTVPNSELTDNVVKNPVAKDQLRLKVPFGIHYDAPIDVAANVVRNQAYQHEDVLNDPKPSVRLTELGDSAVELQARVWIENPSRADFVKIRGEYVQAVKERFDEEGIDIPYPTRTLDGDLPRSEWVSASSVVED